MLLAEEILALVRGEHGDPFAVLGPHVEYLVPESEPPPLQVSSKTKTAKTAAKTAKTTATAKPKTAAKSTKTKKTAKAKTPAKSAKTTAAVRPKTAAKPETRAKKAATDDFELVRSDDHFELVGPSGARVGLRLGTKSRAREPGCRDRVELEISCRAAGKRRWQRVAYLYGRDSYEDELRYVLEDSTLWEAPLTACVAALGTAAAPPRLFAALAERCEDADAEEVIGLLIARWDRVYRRA